MGGEGREVSNHVKVPKAFLLFTSERSRRRRRRRVVVVLVGSGRGTQSAVVRLPR